MKILNVVAFKKRDWFLIVVIALIAAFAYFSEPIDDEGEELGAQPAVESAPSQQ